MKLFINICNKFWFLSGIFLVGLYCTGQDGLYAQSILPADSSFWKLPMQEIDNYRKYYQKEIDRLYEERKKLIDRGIADGKRLLISPRHSEMVDEILIRLADLYYYQDQDQYFSAMENYEASLEISNSSMAPVDEPHKSYNHSISLYKRLIIEFSNSPLIEDALYNMGFLYEELEHIEKALQFYQTLIKQFPRSEYVPEAYMRLGEYYFNPPHNNLEMAIQYYQKIVDFGQSKRYAEAHYKLGWSYYRLSKYPQAISYFTALIEHLDTQRRFGHKEGMKTSLRNEAIEYIAIAFIDFGGPLKANAYVKSIGAPDWGAAMLVKLGDIYMDEKEAYPYAIQCYQDALEYMRISPDVPLIHQKIVDCYHALDDQRNLFLARETLYNKFKAGEIWWRIVENEEARLIAYRLAEKAHRENVNTIIRRAQEQNDLFLYKSVVDLMHSYLEEYSANLYANMIRWNLALILDSRLQLYEDALREYLTISLVYNNEEYKTFAEEKGLLTTKDAAANAIVMADSLVLKERRAPATQLVNAWLYADSSDVSSVQDTLSEAENWLAIAYDNFIKLFPFDAITPTVLSNAGALHYTHHHYDESLRYFRTLMRYFPDSPQSHQVQHSILESYFAKGDYVSTETIAKKILESEMPDSIKNKAERRMGEAMFLRAEALSGQGDTKMAAAEYHRMALETPKLEFADRALFNAGRAYEGTQDYEGAIRAYEALRVSYPTSSMLPDATKNVAFNYGEIGENIKGAQRYEEYAGMMEGKPEAKEALYNAHVFYVKGKAWEKAIETGSSYADKYTDDKDAEIILYSLGRYYLLNTDTLSAIQAYKVFTDRYALSNKSVDALFQTGLLYQVIGKKKNAENVFFKTYERHQTLKDSGRVGDEYFASEALFLSTRLMHNRFEKIRFQQPQDSLESATRRNSEFLERLLNQYAKVVAFQTRRLPEAMFQMGALYEDYGDRWVAQEVSELDAAAFAVHQKKINEQTTLIYEKAFQAYLKSASFLKNLSRKIPKDTVSMDSLAKTRIRELDQMTLSWLKQSEEKISETSYRIAEINTISIQQLLSVPLPDGLTEAEAYEYRSQVLLQAIQPLVNLIIGAHQYNLYVSDSLSLDNPWIEASRDKILKMSFLQSRLYKKLIYDALISFDIESQTYLSLPINDESAENHAMAMGTLIDLSKSYALNMLHFYNEGFKWILKADLKDSVQTSRQDSMIMTIIAISDSLQQYIENNQTYVNIMNRKFEKSGDLWYEDQLTVFEDNVYYLQNFESEFMARSHEMISGFQRGSKIVSHFEMRLLGLDLEKYGPHVSIDLDTVLTFTDSTWLYTTTKIVDWKNNKSKKSQMIPGTRAVNDSIWNYSNIFAIFREDTMQGDSTYYRKEIFIPGMILLGTIQIDADPIVQCWINDEQIHCPVLQSFKITASLVEGKNNLGFVLHHSRRIPVTAFIQVIYVPFAMIPEEMEYGLEN